MSTSSSPLQERPGTTCPNSLTFHHFLLLPYELRYVIWELSLPAPQIHCPKKYPRNENDSMVLLYPLAQNPALLATSREAREVALQRYTLRDLDRLAYFRAKDRIHYPSYIDYTRDWVVFPSEWHFGFPSGNRLLSEEAIFASGFWEKKSFFSRAEMGKVRRLHVFSKEFGLTGWNLKTIVTGWTWPLRSMRELRYTVVVKSIDDEVEWYRGLTGRASVEMGLKGWNDKIGKLIEEQKKQYLADGIVWEGLNLILEVLLADEEEEGKLTYTLSI